MTEMGPLSVFPLTPTIGAMVEGLDLCLPLSTDVVTGAREALQRHKVLFFRGQQPLLEDLVRFGRCFGPLQRYAAGPFAEGPVGERGDPRHPEVRVFEYGPSRRGREAFWHFDVLPSRRPAGAAILRAKVVPEVGGDTLFCDLAALYDGLPPGLRARLEGANAVYDLVFERQLARYRGRSEAEVMALRPEIPLETLPLVRTRADGTKVLLINPAFVVAIEGMSAPESKEVLSELRERIARPEAQYRHRWQAGDVAFWDNQACLHYATNNYFPARRTMERVTVTELASAPC